MNIWTLILVPLIVSILANLATPGARRVIQKIAISTLTYFHLFRSYTLRRKIALLQDELDSATRLVNMPNGPVIFFSKYIIVHVMMLSALALGTAVIIYMTNLGWLKGDLLTLVIAGYLGIAISTTMQILGFLHQMNKLTDKLRIFPQYEATMRTKLDALTKALKDNPQHR